MRMAGSGPRSDSDKTDRSPDIWLAGVEVVASKHTGANRRPGRLDHGEFTVDRGRQHSMDRPTRPALLAQPGEWTMGVLNEGIAGSRLLHDFLGP